MTGSLDDYIQKVPLNISFSAHNKRGLDWDFATTGEATINIFTGQREFNI